MHLIRDFVERKQDEELKSREELVMLKTAMLLRRKVGSEQEDKATDKVQRMRDLHIFIFSMSGIFMMILMSSYMWYSSCKNYPKEGDDCYVATPAPSSGVPTPEPPPQMQYRMDTFFEDSKGNQRTFLSCLQVYVTVSTIITIILICHKYSVILNMKRSQWSGIKVNEVAEKPTGALARAFRSSYDFMSSDMKWELFIEVGIHVPHPIFFIKKSSPTLFAVSQILMFLRMYLLFNLAHHFSPAYRSRIEIVASNKELSRTNFKITTELTSKMLFYDNTTMVVTIIFLVCIMLFGFCIFVVERENDVAEGFGYFFGKMENCVWYVFVTFSTIGYGDFFPITPIGRIVGVLTAAAGITTQILFGGVVTNQVAKTSEHKLVEEYIAVSETSHIYEHAAARLIQRAFREYMSHMSWKLRPRHGSNMAGGPRATWHGAIDRSMLQSDELPDGKASHLPKVAETDPETGRKLSHFQQATNDLRRRIHLGHKGNIMYGALLDIAEARRNLDYARLQSKDVVTETHIAQVCETIESMMETTSWSRHKIEAISSNIDSRMTEITQILKKKKRL
eukprot:PhF_6_TR34215/c1_g1_i5/m.50175